MPNSSQLRNTKIDREPRLGPLSCDLVQGEQVSLAASLAFFLLIVAISIQALLCSCL